MQNLLLVFVGGGLGASLRYGVSLWVPGHWGTWVVNILGSFALALILGHPSLGDPRLRLILGTGLMGGFTTYSTFNADTLRLANEGQLGMAALNVVGTLGLCLLAGAAGLGLAGWLGALSAR